MTTDVQIRERPIIFTAAEVRATLDGRKTQMRQVVPLKGYTDRQIARAVPHNGQDAERGFGGPCYLRVPADDEAGLLGNRERPRWAPGDRLWTREAWAEIPSVEIFSGRQSAEIAFRAGHRFRKPAHPGQPPGEWPTHWGNHAFVTSETKWRPSTHMPRWASRLTLEVVSVRVERLVAISEVGAQAEGIYQIDRGTPYWAGAPHLVKGSPKCHNTAVEAFRDIWDHVNAASARWYSNPWVFATTYRVLEARA